LREVGKAVCLKRLLIQNVRKFPRPRIKRTTGMGSQKTTTSGKDSAPYFKLTCNSRRKEKQEKKEGEREKKKRRKGHPLLKERERGFNLVRGENKFAPPIEEELIAAGEGEEQGKKCKKL